MKSFSTNAILIILAAVLSIAPVQVIASSVSNCMGSKNNMHHVMKMSSQQQHEKMSKAATQHDCCKTTACDMTHCAGFVAIATPVEIPNDIYYTLSEITIIPTESLVAFYPPSLYRPPKA